MAYNNGNASSRNTGNRADVKWEEADGFLNFSLPDEDGALTQVGMIPLRKSDVLHASLFEKLAEDPNRAAKLSNVFSVSFKLNRKKDRTGPVRFNLSALD